MIAFPFQIIQKLSDQHTMCTTQTPKTGLSIVCIIVSALAKDQINPKKMPMRSLDFTYHSQRDILLIPIFDKNQLKYMENTNAHTTEIFIYILERKKEKENTINPITMRIYVYYNRFGSLYYFKCCSYGGASFHPHIKYYCCFTFIFWLRFHSHRCYIIFFFVFVCCFSFYFFYSFSSVPFIGDLVNVIGFRFGCCFFCISLRF